MAEEIKKPEGEDENLNSEDKKEIEGQTPPPPPEKTTYTKEEVEAIKKEMQANGDRGAQKLLDKQKLLEEVVDGVKAISLDAAALLEINDTKPQVAKVILEKYYDGMSLEEFQEFHNIKVDYSDPEVAKRKIATEAQKLADKARVSEKKEEFIKRLKMTPEQIEAFNEAFEERTSMKSFSAKDVVKHLEKAYKEIDGALDLTDLNNAALLGEANALPAKPSTGGDTPPAKKPMEKSRGEAKGFLSKHGI